MKIVPHNLRLYLLLIISVLAPWHCLGLALNGVATFREYGNDIYLGGLYLERPSHDLEEIFSGHQERKLELRFTTEMSKRRWATNWTQSIAINNNREALVESVEELSAVLSLFKGNLKPGDKVEIHYLPGQGASFRINGIELVRSRSERLFNLFLSSWLGAVPPSSQFKHAILGTEDSRHTQERFATLTPAPGRSQVVKGWVAAPAQEQQTTESTPAFEDNLSLDSADPGQIAADKDSPKSVTSTGIANEQSLPSVEPPSPESPPTSPAPVATELVQPQSPAPPEQQDDDAALDLSAANILAQEDYRSELIGKIYRQLRYPAIAVKRKREGSVRVSLTIKANGSMKAITVLEEAEYGLLTKEAVRAIDSSLPFKPFPRRITDSELEIIVPISFRLGQ